MKVYCPKHNENHNVTPRYAEQLIYYLRRLYIEAAYSAPLIVTPISTGVEYTYNRTCVLSELDDIKNIDLEAQDSFNINAAHAIADFNTRRRLDEPARVERRTTRKSTRRFMPSVRE